TGLATPARPRARRAEKTLPRGGPAGSHAAGPVPGGLESGSRPNPIEAATAVDRTIAARQERHFRLYPTGGADRRMQIPADAHVVATAGEPGPPSGSTLGAASRLVHEALGRVELLLTSRK